MPVGSRRKANQGATQPGFQVALRPISMCRGMPLPFLFQDPPPELSTTLGQFLANVADSLGTNICGLLVSMGSLSVGGAELRTV